MALTDWADYVSRVTSPKVNTLHSYGTPGGGLESAWTAAVTTTAGSAPTSPVACNSSTTGTPYGVYNNANGFLLVGGGFQGYLSQYGTLIMYDRLSHMGGLAANSATGSEITTNLPTAALTRYTGGEGVYAMVEMYSSASTPGFTFTIRYTNSAGTGSRTSQSFVQTYYGNQCGIIPLQNGDTGVRSVEGVTLSSNSATAGNFGITLIRPLAIFPMVAFNQPTWTRGPLQMGWNMPRIQSDACVAFLYRGPDIAGGNTSLWLEMIEYP